MDRPVPVKKEQVQPVTTDAYKSDVYAAHPEMFCHQGARDKTKNSSTYRNDVYAVMDRPVPVKTEQAQPSADFKSEVYAAHPEMFCHQGPRDATKNSSTYRNDVYSVMDHPTPTRPLPKSSGVDSYKADVYAANPGHFAEKTSTDAHTSAVYSANAEHLANYTANAGHVDSYKADVYAANPGHFTEKASTDSFTSAIYATAHLGEMNTTPSAVNSYKAAVYAANPEQFAELKKATDEYTSDVYAVAHLGEMVTKSSNDAYTRDVYSAANLDAGNLTQAPTVKVCGCDSFLLSKQCVYLFMCP